MSQTTLAEMKQKFAPAQGNIAMSMETVAGFESMQRIAQLFATSTITPDRDKQKVADCFIAVDMAMRMGANPLMVMQNLYIVHGSPAWSAQFLIATFNKSGRFSALRYEFEGGPGKDDWGCRAVATELATRENLTGPLITIGLAKRQGWYSKSGSKWQTMPEVMLRYRAASFFGKLYAPELLMGLQTAEEVRDATIVIEPGEDGSFEMSMADIEATEESIGEQDEEAAPVASEPSIPDETPTDAHTETGKSKQDAGRQRAAKAASRVKVKESAQAALHVAKNSHAPRLEPGEVFCPRHFRMAVPA